MTTKYSNKSRLDSLTNSTEPTPQEVAQYERQLNAIARMKSTNFNGVYTYRDHKVEFFFEAKNETDDHYWAIIQKSTQLEGTTKWGTTKHYDNPIDAAESALNMIDKWIAVSEAGKPAPIKTYELPQREANIDTWFELSYASYLTVPRSAINSMPEGWRNKLAALLEEMDEDIDWHPSEGFQYRCTLHMPDYDYGEEMRGEDEFDPERYWGEAYDDPASNYRYYRFQPKSGK